MPWPSKARSGNALQSDRASSTGEAVTAGAANTKGSYVTHTTTVAAPDCIGFFFHVKENADALNSEVLIDFAIDPAGTPQVVLSNLAFHSGVSAGRQHSLYGFVPIRLREGTAVGSRCQSNTASYVINVAIVFVYGTFHGLDDGFFESVTSGAVTTDSGGTAVGGPGSANTKGSWVLMNSATGEDTQAIAVGVTRSGIDRVVENIEFRLDIGIGGAGVEVVLIPDIAIKASPSKDMLGPMYQGPFPCFIPSGTRIVCRVQENPVNGGDPPEIILYLFR